MSAAVLGDDEIDLTLPKKRARIELDAGLVECAESRSKKDAVCTNCYCRTATRCKHCTMHFCSRRCMRVDPDHELICGVESSSDAWTVRFRRHLEKQRLVLKRNLLRDLYKDGLERMHADGGLVLDGAVSATSDGIELLYALLNGFGTGPTSKPTPRGFDIEGIEFKSQSYNITAMRIAGGAVKLSVSRKSLKPVVKAPKAPVKAVAAK